MGMTDMSDVTEPQNERPQVGIDFVLVFQEAKNSGAWLLILLYGLVFLPTYVSLSAGPWQTDQDGHGIIIHIISLFILLYSVRDLKTVEPRPDILFGSLALFGGALSLALGRSQSQILFEAGAQIPILIGLTLMFVGWQGLKKVGFAIAFLCFAVPMPGWLLDGFTQNIKLAISYYATELLYTVGYPIAQNGVTMMIGQFELLVKDACAGLNSIYGLLAVGIFYIYATWRDGWFRNICMFALILPAAIIANFIRVLLLALITYHFGEAAGQGFLHDLAGFVMFILALMVFLLVDSLFLLVGSRAATSRG